MQFKIVNEAPGLIYSNLMLDMTPVEIPHAKKETYNLLFHLNDVTACHTPNLFHQISQYFCT
jgi:hypothetical protein